MNFCGDRKERRSIYDSADYTNTFDPIKRKSVPKLAGESHSESTAKESNVN